VGTMVGLQYIRMEEVGALPRRAEPFPGPKIGDVVERLETVVHANRALETYHEGRRASV
jgi:hypothetical protein